MDRTPRVGETWLCDCCLDFVDIRCVCSGGRYLVRSRTRLSGRTRPSLLGWHWARLRELRPSPVHEDDYGRNEE